MSIGTFIASRLIKDRNRGTAFSRPINVIAIIGIALGLAVMILAVSILTGFKQQIRDKVAGFGAHIQVVNFDANLSYETVPVSSNQPFVSKVRENPGIRNVQVFATPEERAIPHILARHDAILDRWGQPSEQAAGGLPAPAQETADA